MCCLTYTYLSYLTVYRAGQSTKLSICERVFLFWFRHTRPSCKWSHYYAPRVEREADSALANLRIHSIAIIVYSLSRRSTFRLHRSNLYISRARARAHARIQAASSRFFTVEIHDSEFRLYPLCDESLLKRILVNYHRLAQGRDWNRKRNKSRHVTQKNLRCISVASIVRLLRLYITVGIKSDVRTLGDLNVAVDVSRLNAHDSVTKVTPYGTVCQGRNSWQAGWVKITDRYDMGKEHWKRIKLKKKSSWNSTHVLQLIPTLSRSLLLPPPPSPSSLFYLHNLIHARVHTWKKEKKNEEDIFVDVASGRLVSRVARRDGTVRLMTKTPAFENWASLICF